ncbi:MAG: hypothetical protein QOE46_1573 [Acidobacteriota bacterium]|jgi:hypothetical protein|nr:hypothetical protein [Acidobacteriota bacterium]
MKGTLLFSKGVPFIFCGAVVAARLTTVLARGPIV